MDFGKKNKINLVFPHPKVNIKSGRKKIETEKRYEKSHECIISKKFYRKTGFPTTENCWRIWIIRIWLALLSDKFEDNSDKNELHNVCVCLCGWIVKCI